MTNFETMTIRELFAHADNPGRYGIEVEVEGRNLPQIAGWNIHQEGSLRNGGIEYVLPRPVDSAQIDAYLILLQSGLTARGVQVIPSHRTSTHIHINMLNETVETVLRYITIYTIFDPLINKICGPQRDGNLFCLSMLDTGDIQVGVTQFIRAIKNGNLGAILPRGKYASLNMTPLWRFGSLECRVFPMSIHAEQIKTWINWLDRILNLAKGNRTLYDIVNEAISNPQHLVSSIFLDTGYSDDVNRKYTQAGAQQAYEVLTVINSEISKKKELTLNELEEIAPHPILQPQLNALDFERIRAQMRDWAPVPVRPQVRRNRNGA